MTRNAYQHTEVLTAYAERFPNLMDLLHPAMMTGPAFEKFERLAKMAIRRGSALTQGEIDRGIGPQPWEW
jgi:hypothetical protein